MHKKLLFLILAIVLVVASVIVSIVIICKSGSKRPNPEESENTTEQDTIEETTQSEQTQPEPDTTAAPNTEEEDTSAPDTPISLPANSDAHKSANFGNVLFIGDSRTVGLRDYADLGAADVFAENGLNIFRLFKDAVNVPGKGQITLENLLLSNQYDKIYVMLGINEIGYNLDKVIEKFCHAID